MPVRAARLSRRGLPPLGLGGSSGNSGSTISQSSSLTNSLAILLPYPDSAVLKGSLSLPSTFLASKHLSGLMVPPWRFQLTRGPSPRTPIANVTMRHEHAVVLASIGSLALRSTTCRSSDYPTSWGTVVAVTLPTESLSNLRSLQNRLGLPSKSLCALRKVYVIDMVFLNVREAARAEHYLVAHRSTRRLPTLFDRPRTPCLYLRGLALDRYRWRCR